MENLKRCPICFHLPNFHYDVSSNLWHGGCESRATETCLHLSDVVLQPSVEESIAQWNDVIAPFANLLAEVA